MSCSISGSNIKVLGKAIHTISKLGEELYFDSTEDGLVLKTISAARSAFATFTFKVPQYFLHYSLESGLRWKLPVKSILLAFKSIHTLEKSVERCSLEFDEDTLTVLLLCKHGLEKRFELPLVECESFVAQFNAATCPSHLETQAKLLLDGVHNFSTTVEEVSLITNPNKILLRNYFEDEPDYSKVVHTELGYEKEEFEVCAIETNIEITFCLKEFRAILGFAEGFNASLSLHFHKSGKPILFRCGPLSGVEAEFVLATLSDPGATSSQSTVATTQPPRSLPPSQGRQTPLHRSTPPQIEEEPLAVVAVEEQNKAKEFKRFFLGLSQTSDYSVMTQNPEVLVAASDDEDER